VNLDDDIKEATDKIHQTYIDDSKMFELHYSQNCEAANNRHKAACEAASAKFWATIHAADEERGKLHTQAFKDYMAETAELRSTRDRDLDELRHSLTPATPTEAVVESMVVENGGLSDVGR
jgi:hypothetical protein